MFEIFELLFFILPFVTIIVIIIELNMAMKAIFNYIHNDIWKWKY